MRMLMAAIPIGKLVQLYQILVHVAKVMNLIRKTSRVTCCKQHMAAKYQSLVDAHCNAYPAVL
jgi:hypothetical protein